MPSHLSYTFLTPGCLSRVPPGRIHHSSPTNSFVYVLLTPNVLLRIAGTETDATRLIACAPSRAIFPVSENIGSKVDVTSMSMSRSPRYCAGNLSMTRAADWRCIHCMLRFIARASRRAVSGFSRSHCPVAIRTTPGYSSTPKQRFVFSRPRVSASRTVSIPVSATSNTRHRSKWRRQPSLVPLPRQRWRAFRY
jgi:hypothetical protein